MTPDMLDLGIDLNVYLQEQNKVKEISGNKRECLGDRVYFRNLMRKRLINYFMTKM